MLGGDEQHGAQSVFLGLRQDHFHSIGCAIKMFRWQLDACRVEFVMFWEIV
jgi:hypothetical protein